MFATCRAFAVTLVVVVACGGPHDPPTDEIGRAHV